MVHKTASIVIPLGWAGGCAVSLTIEEISATA